MRDIRLTRNAAAADPAGAAAIGYLRIVTTAPTADPRTYLNAFVQVLRVDGREPVVRRYDIPASSLAGPPLEVDPGKAGPFVLRPTALPGPRLDRAHGSLHWRLRQ